MKIVAMMKETVRTHVVLPRDLVEAVDTLVGKRTRSEFVEQALREKGPVNGWAKPWRRRPAP